jgi:hypothetical protein
LFFILWTMRVLFLLKSSLPNFFSYMLLILYLKSHHQTQGHLDFPLCYRSFIVFYLYIYVYLYSELIFINGLKSVSRFFLLLMRSSSSFLKRLSSRCLVIFAPLSNLSWVYLCGSISGLSILFFWLICHSSASNSVLITVVLQQVLK